MINGEQVRICRDTIMIYLKVAISAFTLRTSQKSYEMDHIVSNLAEI